MISVVIPAYNEEKIIGKTLDSLVEQKTSEKFEVIVVDNNSTDKTVEIVNSYKDKLDLKLIKEQKKGRSPARRAGFLAARGDIIFSTDADTIVPEDWIERMLHYFTDPAIVAVTGTGVINDSGRIINSLFNALQPVSMKIFRLLMGNYWLTGFNFAIRKSTYEKSGGFDLDLNSQEDTDLAFRVKKLGQIKFIKHPAVFVSGRRFNDGFLRGVYSYIDSYIRYFFFKDKKRTFLSDVR